MILRKSKTPRKSPEKCNFLSLAFYNAPSLHTVKPPLPKNPRPPLKQGILWAWGFASRKNQKLPGAHKIGAAISGPRIVGGNYMDITLLLNYIHRFIEMPGKFFLVSFHSFHAIQCASINYTWKADFFLSL